MKFTLLGLLALLFVVLTGCSRSRENSVKASPNKWTAEPAWKREEEKQKPVVSPLSAAQSKLREVEDLVEQMSQWNRGFFYENLNCVEGSDPKDVSALHALLQKAKADPTEGWGWTDLFFKGLPNLDPLKDKDPDEDDNTPGVFIAVKAVVLPGAGSFEKRVRFTQLSVSSKFTLLEKRVRSLYQASESKKIQAGCERLYLELVAAKQKIACINTLVQELQPLLEQLPKNSAAARLLKEKGHFFNAVVEVEVPASTLAAVEKRIAGKTLPLKGSFSSILKLRLSTEAEALLR